MDLCLLALGMISGFGIKLYLDNKKEINSCIKKMIKDNEKNLKDLKKSVEM